MDGTATPVTVVEMTTSTSAAVSALFQRPGQGSGSQVDCHFDEDVVRLGEVRQLSVALDRHRQMTRLHLGVRMQPSQDLRVGTRPEADLRESFGDLVLRISVRRDHTVHCDECGHISEGTDARCMDGGNVVTDRFTVG